LSSSSAGKKSKKKKDAFSFEVGGHLDNKTRTINPTILSEELNIPILDVGKIKIAIFPLIEIQKARIEGSIKKNN
jgi:hypothetical protein